MTEHQPTKEELSDQVFAIANSVLKSLPGVRLDVVAVAAVNILLHAALQGKGGDEREAEKYVRHVVDLGIAGMHRAGGALQ